MSIRHEPPRPNKTEATNGSYGICRVINAFRSPSPDPSRSAKIMSRHSIIKLGLAAGGWLIVSCSNTDNTIARAPSSQRTNSAPTDKTSQPRPSAKEAQQPTILVREWSFRDGREYRDRNGDGIVDWQATGTEGLADGYEVYKEDNDYDGYYEREYEAGGYAYKVNYDRGIREPVPQIHRVYPPTRISRKPKAEQAGANQSATAPKSKPEDNSNPKPEAEGRSR